MIATINGFTISTVKASPGTSYHRLSRQRARDMVLSRMGSKPALYCGHLPCPCFIVDMLPGTDFEVFTEAGSGDGGVSTALALSPDLLLLEMSMSNHGSPCP